MEAFSLNIVNISANSLPIKSSNQYQKELIPKLSLVAWFNKELAEMLTVKENAFSIVQLNFGHNCIDTLSG